MFSRPRFFRGEMLSEAGLKDITWVTPAGVEATGEDWGNPVGQALGYVLCGAAGEFYTPGGQRDIDESFLVMMNAYHGDLDFHFPKLPTPLVWEALVDTAEPTGRAEPGRIWKPGEAYLLRAHSLRAVHQPCVDAAIAGATQRSFRLRGCLRRRWRRVPRTEARRIRGGRVMRRHHQLPFGAEIVRGMGRRACASGYGRRARQTWRWCSTGARRNRSRCGRSRTGGGR